MAVAQEHGLRNGVFPGACRSRSRSRSAGLGRGDRRGRILLKIVSKGLGWNSNKKLTLGSRTMISSGTGFSARSKVICFLT